MYLKVCCIFTLFALSQLSFAESIFAKNEPNIIKNWFYRFGYSKVDSSGVPCWLADSLTDSNWKTITNIYELPQNKNENSLWLKTVLPNYDNRETILYIGQVEKFIQVYLNKKLIYELGDFTSPDKVGTLGFNQNLIQLPPFSHGDILTLRIWSDSSALGVAGNVSIGSSFEILKDLFMQDVVSLSFIALFFVGGLLALFVYLVYLRIKLVLAIVIFLIPLSLFSIGNSLFLQALMQTPYLFYQLDFIGLVATTVGGFYAIEQTVADKYKIVIRTIWQLHFLILIFSVVLDLTSVIHYQKTFNYFGVILLINMIINIILMILSTRNREFTNKVLMIGMVVFLFSASMEVVFYFMNQVDSVFNYSIKFLHFGAGFYVLMLIWLIISNYLKTVKERESAQRVQLEVIKRENDSRELFSKMLIESQENERKRISSELHDSLGQNLIILKNMIDLDIRNIKAGKENNLAQLSDLASTVIEETRTIAGNLHPYQLKRMGLTKAVKALVRNLKSSSTLDINERIDEIEGVFPKETEAHIFRIFQESMNNVIKHSEASSILVSLKRDENIININISDNGKGFDLKKFFATEPVKAGGWGLYGLSERCRIIGGTLDLQSELGKGTKVEITVPINDRIK